MKEFVSVNNDEVRNAVQPDPVLPRDERGRISWVDIKNNPDELKRGIENEIRQLMSRGVDISFPGLKKVSLSGLAYGINLYYPGGMTALRGEFGLATRVRSGYWRDINNLESEAQRLVTLGSNLTESSMRETGATGFLKGIRESYPGGLGALRAKVGVEDMQKPKNYWKDPEVIKSEAKELLSIGNNLSDNSLESCRKSSLAQAARKYYPGGLRQLRIDLGQTTELRKPDGYWTEENIEKEARDFLENGGVLTQQDLAKNERFDLSSAIRNYPGGFRGLKEKLDIENKIRPDGYWTVEAIEKETRDHILEEGILSTETLRKKPYLRSAIAKFYPGKMGALRRKLGVEIDKKPKGYWTDEQVEKDALAFFWEEGVLTFKALEDKKRFDLINAIYSSYPDSLYDLRKKLGIKPKVERKPHGYWNNEEHIRNELIKVISTLGHFPTVGDIEGMGLLSLRSVVVKSGGFKKWREKLGITNRAENDTMTSPEQANEQLEKLLETK